MSKTASPLATEFRHKYVLSDRTQAHPSEILTEIFKNVCGGHVMLPPPDSGYPWILGHVCSRWWQILWNSPVIWNKIMFGNDHIKHRPPVQPHSDGIYHHNYTTDKTFHYILLNVNTPISLTVSDAHAHFRYISTIILTHIDRFTKPSLNYVPQNTLFSLLSLPLTSFNLLEKLSLSLGYIHESIQEYTASPFENAPNLRNVTYKAPNPETRLAYFPLLFLLPCARIQSLYVNSIWVSPDIIWEILESSPSLLSCAFIINNVPVVSSTCKICAPALKVLKLEAEYVFDWETFLRPIVTPSLEDLDI
jgi:hypothetical protein